MTIESVPPKVELPAFCPMASATHSSTSAISMASRLPGVPPKWIQMAIRWDRDPYVMKLATLVRTREHVANIISSKQNKYFLTVNELQLIRNM